MAGAAALPANLKAETTDVAPARLAGTASMVRVFRPAQMSDEAAPVLWLPLYHVDVRLAFAGAAVAAACVAGLARAVGTDGVGSAP